MNRILYLCVAVLVVIAAAGIYYKVHYLKFNLFPRNFESMWQIEGRIQFTADGNPVLVSLAAPQSQPGFRVFSLDERSDPNYAYHLVGTGDNRRAEWTSGPVTGDQVFLFRMKIYDTIVSKDTLSATAPELGPEPFWEGEGSETIAKEIIDACAASPRNGNGNGKGNSSDDGKESGGEEDAEPAPPGRPPAKAGNSDKFNNLVLSALDQVFNPPDNSRVGMLLPPAPTTDDRIRLLINLLRMREIPARIVSGVQLVDKRTRANLIKTVEVFHDGAWHGFDVADQKPGFPHQLLTLRRGGKSLLDVEGGYNSNIRYSVTRTTIPASVLTTARNDALGRTIASLSMYDLPLDSQNAFQRIALLPLGILIIVIIRNLIGIQTMGTFTPVLIALAFTETTLIPGLISFICIVTVGMLIRSYLSHLNLLLVPRIGAVVMVVIFLMKTYSLISYRIGFTQGLTVTMFPLIILAWVIERAAIIWEEDGPANTIRQLVASLASGIVCYGAMSNRYVRHLTFAFSEIDLIFLAILLLLGSYTGYRLTELKRFSSLVKK